MNLLESVKDFFGGPDASFQKLLMPEYFSNKRPEFDSVEKYARWLRKIQTEFGSMAFVKKNQGMSVPENWLDGLRKIEDEMDKVRSESGSNIFPPDDGIRMSDSLK